MEVMTCLKLSHSASTKYQECAKAYEYHYIKRYRQKVQSSPLLFGTAIDKAGEHYALTKDFDATLKVFDDTWLTQNIGGKDEDLRFLLNFTYSDRDLDTDLLKSEDWESMVEDLGLDPDDFEEALKEVVYEKSSVGFKNLTDQQKKIFNYSNWLCLKRKGILMLKEFKRVFDENVEEVLGTQVKVDLENENGDAVVGFADFVFKWKGIEKPIVFDLKTAGREYDEDAVSKSPQLSLYVFSLSHQYSDTRNAGFIVLGKNINKNKTKKCALCSKDGTGQRHKTCDAVVNGARCNGEWIEKLFPKAKSQVLIETVSEILVERVVENFNEVNKAIKAEIFPRNFSNCIKYNGAIKCAFYDLCHANSMENLECKKED